MKNRCFFTLLIIFLFNFVKPDEKYIYFQNLLNKTELTLQKELDSKNTSVDIILITARNANEKKFYDKIIKYQRPYLFHKDTEVVVISDPKNKGGFIGSTGSLFCALDKLKKLYKKQHKKDFKNLRISIIKAGGMARRMIAASVYANKCQMPLPVEKDNIYTNTLYYAILNSYFLGQKMQTQGFSGLIVLCSDQLFLSDSAIKEGINYFIDPVSSIEAKRSELIIEDSNTRKIIDFKRKPSNTLRQEIINNSKGKEIRIWAELTNNYIIAYKTFEFYNLYERYFKGSDKIKKLIAQSSRGYEIFTSDCILPFFMNENDYIALRLKEYQTPDVKAVDFKEKRTEFYKRLYKIVKRYFYSTIYLCGDEHNTYCEEIVDMIRFYKNGLMPLSKVAKIYQFRNLSKSVISQGASIAEDSCIYRSTLSEDTKVSKQSVILDSNLYPKSVVGEDSIVINVKGQINIGSKNVLARIPIKFENRDAYALVYVGIDDNPKNEDESATIFGEPLKAWLVRKNITFDPNNISIFTIPLFPVVFEDELNMQYISWMTQDATLPIDIYKKSKHVSLQDITSLINYNLLTQMQQRML
jgi:ADP-glucose pyrophosphorylase